MMTHPEQRKLGVIEELVKVNDGFIKSVTLHTSGHTNQPIACLYPLEVSTDD